MSVMYPQIGNKVVAKVIEKQGDCTIGMDVGDEYELSIHKCGEFCGFFYHNIFGWVKTFQFGGSVPLGDDPDVMVVECPNANNRLKVELRKVK